MGKLKDEFMTFYPKDYPFTDSQSHDIQLWCEDNTDFHTNFFVFGCEKVFILGEENIIKFKLKFGDIVK